MIEPYIISFDRHARQQGLRNERNRPTTVYMERRTDKRQKMTNLERLPDPSRVFTRSDVFMDAHYQHEELEKRRYSKAAYGMIITIVVHLKEVLIFVTGVDIDAV